MSGCWADGQTHREEPATERAPDALDCSVDFQWRWRWLLRAAATAEPVSQTVRPVSIIKTISVSFVIDVDGL